MGNRAVITTEDNFNNNGIGIYLHWNGGYDSVNAFLKYAKLKGIRGCESDPSYFWARFCQVIGNYFGGTLSLGIDTIDKLGCDFCDNGVYLINDDFEIVGRKYYSGEEQNNYDLKEMLHDINNAQKDNDRLPKENIDNEIVKHENEYFV